MRPGSIVSVLVSFAVCAPTVLAADRIEMTIARNDERIGSHTITFVEDGARLHVDTRVEVAVKLAFVTVYRLRKTSRETWADGRLLSYDVDIDDNGTKSAFRAREEGGKLVVDGPEGRVMAPRGTMMSGYWTEDTVTRTLLVDSSDGVLRKVVFSKPVVEVLGTGVDAIETRRYRMTGDLERDLWYGPDRRLVRLREVARDNSVIVTELESISKARP